MSPTSDEVRRQLDRLLASAGFANAGRMSRFLKFIVDRTLAGQGDRLKEYVIGVEVFDRDADYDPRVDAIVRVEAARLRSKLAEYYAGEGAGDPVVLTLPKGGYAPGIKLVGAAAAASGHAGDAAANGAATNGSAALAATPPAVSAAPPVPARDALRGWLAAAVVVAAATLAVAAWAPWSDLASARGLRVAVLPFMPYPDGAGADAVAMRITEGVTAELVRDGRFAVVASSAASAAAAAAARPRDVAATLAADVLIEARLTVDGERVRIEARAASAEEQKFWVQSFAGSAADSDALASEIAAAIGNALSAANVVPAD